MKQVKFEKKDIKRNAIDEILAYYHEKEVDRFILARFLSTALYSIVEEKERIENSEMWALVLGDMIKLVAATNDDELRSVLDQIFFDVYDSHEVKMAINKGFTAAMNVKIEWVEEIMDNCYQARKWLIGMNEIAENSYWQIKEDLVPQIQK